MKALSHEGGGQRHREGPPRPEQPAQDGARSAAWAAA
eukprot:CAMPEP_0172627590 /NCGR_PEP_ID=MMETSP1068-20121228/157112_1 /TAXON_ID=35684 /ORGANISM="Pseudopedinella elastica, Strain CCMP716" /LENGTH=36 /DNA_ID= /DNA_START= /DNA_END= /DNA_ORIENTATION=